MNTKALIDILGGPAQAARICDVGTSAAMAWIKSTNGIPPWHWASIVRHAEREGIRGVTYDAIQATRAAAREGAK